MNFDIIDFVSTTLTNEPILSIMVILLVGFLLQLGVSSIVLSKRKHILQEEYGYNDKQIQSFYWKSIILFPVTWFLFLSQGCSWFVRKLKRR